MATYTFECLKCRHRGEQVMPMAKVATSMKLACSQCEIKTLQKQIINTARPVQFLGAGWPDKGGN